MDWCTNVLNLAARPAINLEDSEFDETLPTSDAILLARLHRGESDAATELFERYAERILRLAKRQGAERLSVRLDAEDIVQSVFRTFFRRAAEGHYQIPDGDELWKLLLVIALNKLRKRAQFHHAAKRDLGRTQTMGVHQPAKDPDTTEILKMTIDDLVAKMPANHQQIIRDRILGFEVSDLALRNATSKRTVERVLKAFRDRLRAELEGAE